MPASNRKPTSNELRCSETKTKRLAPATKRDLTPAKQLGLGTALALYGRMTEEEGTPDYELTEIQDLSKIAQA